MTIKTAQDMLKEGGVWLGAARHWIQWNCNNGSTVTWGSNEQLSSSRGFTPAVVDEIAAEAVAAYINSKTEKRTNLLKHIAKLSVDGASEDQWRTLMLKVAMGLEP